MNKRIRLVRTLARRELADYFSTPTGYVFISLFVFLSAVAAFWQDQFFANNLANLDALNRFFPYLLVFFIPAISMSLFSEERKQGTDELLLTLPASDAQVVLGKYLAGVSIYSVALFFSLSHVIVLRWLGHPDLGLMAATYAGYWIIGSALLAVAMLGSLLTENLTIAFILGGIFCAVPVFASQSETVSHGAFQRVTRNLSAVEQLRDAVLGSLTPHFIVYFAGMAIIALYLNVALLGRRRWPTGPKAPHFAVHYVIRAVGLILAMGSLTILASQLHWRWDATSEKIHSLSKDTVALLRSLDPKEPVFITAYFSPEVPTSYAEARNGLTAMLREFEAVARDAVQARVIDTVKYSTPAREAEDRFNIRPYKLPAGEEGSGAVNEIFMGLVFTRGAEEFVIPFFDRGLPAEYELMRSIRVVSRAKRKKIGILDTPVRLFGDFDFQTRRQNQQWAIVTELKKQYDVAQVSADSSYPEDLDALIAAQPSALMQAQADRLTDYVKSGKPVLVMLDPFPSFNLGLAPQDVAQDSSQLPFQQPQESTTKANLGGLKDALGMTWATDRIAWDNYNPHPQFRSLPKEFVFVGQGFNAKDPITAGLQEAVLLYPGAIKPKDGASMQFTPLLEAGPDSGTVSWKDLVQRGIFGEVSVNENIKHTPDKTKPILAARVKGAVNAVVVADVDLMGEQFFDLRRRGIENLNFDNVTFLLNAVDDLASDSSFIELRKRRPKHRTLEAVEARTRTYESQRLDRISHAEANADTQLKEAQARLDKSVKEIDERKDLDEEAKQVMMANVQGVENRRLQVARTTIEDEKQRQIEASRADMENSVRTIQSTIKLMAVVLPPIPAVLLFVLVSLRRLARERRGVPVDRLVDRTTEGTRE